MKKKRAIIIFSGVIITALALLGIIFYPKYKANKEINSLSKEVTMFNDYIIKGNGTIDDIIKYINKDIASGNRKVIEDNLDNYIKDILKNKSEFEKLENYDVRLEELSNKEKRKEILANLNKNNEELTIIKEGLRNIENNYDGENLEDVHIRKQYIDISSNINTKSLEEKFDETIKSNNDKVSVMGYLDKDNNWKIEDNKIIFTKRNSFNEYKKLNNKIIDYELIKDTAGPVITASDITITKGTKINIKDKVKCVDAVDDKVECKIDGKYDYNKVGSYSIKVTAVDESKNSSTKSIKLKVKEKTSSTKPTAVSGKPYYIEVIRNHNVVIVYGLDSNNKYTKIVKVFICSTGKSTSKTPTGTFKTSDKSSWGWLVGNLYGQYYTRITGSILFHSVPYTKKAKNTLEWDEYNKLGTSASKGCVRMTVKDVKWIYDNCPRGTTVKIYDGSLPSGVVKPTAPKISADSPNKGWDPTDPDKNNPWKK